MDVDRAKREGGWNNYVFYNLINIITTTHQAHPLPTTNSKIKARK
jgi:hypothetical protein